MPILQFYIFILKSFAFRTFILFSVLWIFCFSSFWSGSYTNLWISCFKKSHMICSSRTFSTSWVLSSLLYFLRYLTKFSSCNKELLNFHSSEPHLSSLDKDTLIATNELSLRKLSKISAFTIDSCKLFEIGI